MSLSIPQTASLLHREERVFGVVERGAPVGGDERPSFLMEAGEGNGIVNLLHFFPNDTNANIDLHLLRKQAVAAAEDEDQAVELHTAFDRRRLNS